MLVEYRFQFCGRSASHAQPRRDCTGFASGMGKLDANALSLTMSIFHDSAQRGNLRILPETTILRSDSAFGDHRRGFDKRQARAS